MDCSLPGSSIHGITQARILEWVAISFSRRSSWPQILYHGVTREAKNCNYWIKKKACVNFCCVLAKFFSEDCIDFHYNEWICLFLLGPMEKKDCRVFKLLSIYWLKQDILMLFSFESSKSELEHILISLVQLLSHCLTLCVPMDCSPPGLPVHHQLPELAQTHVHRVHDAIQPSQPLSSPSPPTFNLSQHQGLFKWVSS